MSSIDSIRQLMNDYAIAHQAGDGAAIARLFRDDAVIIPPNKPAIEGRAAINEFFSDVSDGADLTTESSTIRVEDPLAYAYGVASWEEDGGRKYFCSVEVYRLEDRHWKFQMLTWNTSTGFAKP